MSVESKEIISDIVADIRAQNQGLPEDSYALSPLVCDLLSLADRIEAAAKREREAGADKEAEIARLKAALSASNDKLDLARSNSRAMYHRLNAENIRITEMDRDTIHYLREENARLRAALKPVLDAYISQDDPSADVYDSRLDSAFALKSVREAKRIYKEQCDERKS